MDDIYAALIGEGAGSGEKAALVAAALRRRNSLGTLGMLTGDRVLSPLGQGMNKQADAYVESLQQIRQKDIDNAQTKSYQDGQLGHMENVLAETKRNNNLDYLARMEMAQAAMERAERTGQRPTKLTLGDRNKLENMSSMLTQAGDVVSRFKPEYAQKFGRGPQSRLPNTMSSMGFGTESMDEASRWWADWNLLYTLPERNRTFGATLTDSEKQAWKESDINPSMSPENIQARSTRILKILRDKGTLMDRTYRAQFSPEVIDEYGLPGGEVGGGPSAQAGGAAGGAGSGTGATAPKRLKKVNGQWVPQ